MRRFECGVFICLVASFPWWAVATASAQAVTPAVSASTQRPAAPMTLLQAYRLAVEQDAIIRTARAGADARRERIPQARAALMPNVTAQASYNKNDLNRTEPGLTGLPVESQVGYASKSSALILRQPIFRPFQIADYRQAQAQVADANAILDRETQNLASRVTGAYMEALLAQDQLALVAAQKTSYTTQLDAAKKRFAGGAGVRTDIDEAQARLDMALAKELEARQNVAYTRRQLQVMVNTPVMDLAPVDEAKLRTAPPPGHLEDWIERAELTSPELRSLKAQRDAARHEYDKARAGHLPTLDAVAQWTVSDSENVTRINSRYENKSIGLQLNVPLFAGGLVSSQSRQALADIERAEQALEATRRDLNLRVEKEYRGVTEGTLSIRALEQAVRSAETMVVSNRRSFEGGARTLVDVLNAEEQRVTALRDLANARYLYLISRIRLKALSGVADEEAIAELSSWLRP
ncbi:MAG TPA: TolC family outer membrane protein [Ramlibacter sp.]|nr:TolC family outer membrane protein [Ramlibacter sp.]